MDDCPLCDTGNVQHYYRDKSAEYLKCLCCDLVFVPKRYHFNEMQEKARYDTHQNNPQDTGYREFLKHTLLPVVEHLSKCEKGLESQGLDFGCGPGPTLSLMFTEQGYKMDLFDKFYAKNPAVFKNKYDFITATEVAEHLHHPKVELTRLFMMLNAGGVLALMTQILDETVIFDRWYYKNDPTHICFFSRKTLQHLAQQWQAKIQFYGNNVVLFTRDV